MPVCLKERCDMKNWKSAFTLVELIIVVIIIGILVTIGMISYIKTQERAFDNDARASVKLIQAAERVYRLENGFYYPNGGSTSSHIDINNNLRLTLPTSSLKWTYTVNSAGGTSSASALRTGGADIRTWILPMGSDDATCSGAGCP